MDELYKKPSYSFLKDEKFINNIKTLGLIVLVGLIALVLVFIVLIPWLEGNERFADYRWRRLYLDNNQRVRLSEQNRKRRRMLLGLEKPNGIRTIKQQPGYHWYFNPYAYTVRLTNDDETHYDQIHNN